MGYRLKFWMVWREDSPTTEHRHQTKRDADIEAERLARMCPGKTFYVLKAVSAMSSLDVPIERHELYVDDVPF